MMRIPTMKSWSAEQWLLGGMVLALAATCVGLLLAPQPTASAHLIALALLVASLAAALLVMRVAARTHRRMEAMLRGQASGEQRAMEALRNSEAQWKEVFEHNPVMYFMVDATGLVLSVNTFGAAQLGYTVDELLGQSVLRVFAAEDRDIVLRNVAACLDKIGQPHSWEIRKVRKDASRLWVRENAKAVRRLDGQLIVLIACEDITERKQAENALQQSEMYLTEAQRLSHTGSFGWHVASGEIIWSDETFRIFEFDRVPSIKHATVLQRVHPDDRSRVQRTIDRASLDGNDFEHGYRLLMPNGTIKHVHARAHAVTNLAGDTEFVGAVTDVTARKRAEAELHDAQTNLAHVTRVTALGELAASIAHEVNQPLAAVVANAAACLRWLNRAAPDLNEARGAVRSIISDGNRAGEVIQRVRALVNKTADQKAPLDINEAINEVIGLVQHQLQSQHVSLQLELAPALPPVVADRIQLQQVILNLVMNGIEAMQPVTDRPRQLVIRTRQDDAGQIVVAVTDCGVGIAAENVERLFDAFYSTKASGMGMGLSICRSIVEAHRGRLSATGNSNRGATFQFTLPLRQEDHAW
ncbi:PAS domain-containing sensor histidine kinase [Bradyrhizobium sp. USDA 4451]